MCVSGAQTTVHACMRLNEGWVGAYIYDLGGEVRG